MNQQSLGGLQFVAGIILLLPLTVCGMIGLAIRTPAAAPAKAPTDWPPMILQYREAGELSFIWDMEPGSQSFEFDYTDAAHWTHTVLSSTVAGAEKASATLDNNVLTTSRPAESETFTQTIEGNFAPNEWLSYYYLSTLQKKPTVVLKEGPEPGEITAVETFERPCIAVATFEGIKKCDEGQKNSVVVREFTYRAADYILPQLVSKVDGAVVEEVTLEKLTFK